MDRVVARAAQIESAGFEDVLLVSLGPASFAAEAILKLGPRYLYNVGQLYSDGPPKGLVILLTANPEEDLVVPGADYTLGQIQIGMAHVEFESLGRLRRPAIRLHLTKGADAGLAQLEMILSYLPAM